MNFDVCFGSFLGSMGAMCIYSLIKFIVLRMEVKRLDNECKESLEKVDVHFKSLMQALREAESFNQQEIGRH